MKLPARLKNACITVGLLCVLGGLAWITRHFSAEVDITRTSSNTLSVPSQTVLATLSDDVKITAYIKKEAVIRLQIEQLIERYRRYKADVSLTFVDPSSVPEKIRSLNIGSDGGILVEYQGRTERLIYIDETSLTNALFQLAAANERWVSFLSGHGERTVDGVANFDLLTFSKALSQHKIRARSLNLATVQAIPDNSKLLVISAPAVPFMAGELTLIKHYIEQGGNLLVLTDPDNNHLKPLLDLLGVRVLAGKLVDGQSKLYGIDDPSFIVTSEYPKHPLSKGFQTITVYPIVSALEIEPTSPFASTPLLRSGQQSWTETGDILGKIRFDANTSEKSGPLNFAYALTRDMNQEQQQRIIVMGDGDFLSNSYIGNVGNLDMGLRLINWLLHDDQLIDIPAKAVPDSKLALSPMAITLVSFFFLIILPLGLLIIGFLLWRKRNRR